MAVAMAVPVLFPLHGVCAMHLCLCACVCACDADAQEEGLQKDADDLRIKHGFSTNSGNVSKAPPLAQPRPQRWIAAKAVSASAASVGGQLRL